MMSFTIAVSPYTIFRIYSSLFCTRRPAPFPFTMNTPFPYALDPTANKKPYIYGVSCTVYTLAVVSVALRLISRRISRAGFQADDYLIVVSLIIDTALFIDIMLLLHDGLGQHLKSLVQYSSFMKVYIFGDVMYTCTLALTKYSILCFYWRIFGHVKKIRWPIYILIGLTTAWLIEVVSRFCASTAILQL